MAQSSGAGNWRVLEINGGQVVKTYTGYRFQLTAATTGYADAQIDDYGGKDGRFMWQPGITMGLRARYSHDVDRLRGTAGFGFWNAPYGEPSRRRPALPRAAWFFYASAPNDLPFAPGSPGRGWFAATIDATSPRALALIPLAPALLAFNQWTAARHRLWPAVRNQLGINAAPLMVDMREWHEYQLTWRAGSCRFMVDGRTVLETPQSVRGPLGFVCWLDNQHGIGSPLAGSRTNSLNRASSASV